MNGERLLAATVAVVCVLALGVSSTSLESSLSSDPADVVSPLYDGLPYDSEDFSAVREAVSANEEDAEASSSQSATEGQPAQRSQGASDRGDPTQAEASGQSETESTGGQGQDEQGLGEQLLGLLQSLWPLLVGLLVLLLLYRYRDRLRALLVTVLGGLGPEQTAWSDAEPDPWTDLTPANDVERAWLTMVRSAGLSRPWAKTPGECAQAAIDAGMEPGAVKSITLAFEEVRYGGEPVTQGRERLARQGLRTLDLGRNVV